MSEKKIKIKDLAVELKVDPSDLLNTAKKAGISASGPNAMVSQEEAAKIRSQQAGQQESGSRVIVRRRKAAQDKQGAQAAAPTTASDSASDSSAAEAADNAAAAESSAEKPAAEKTAAKEPHAKIVRKASGPRKDEKQDAGAGDGAADKAGDKPAEQAADKAAASAAGKADQPAKVKIISRPGAAKAEKKPGSASEAVSGTDSETATDSAAQGASKATAAADKAAADNAAHTTQDAASSAAKPASQAAAQSTPASQGDAAGKDAAGKEAGAEAQKQEVRRPKVSVTPEIPKVRIISRPGPQEAKPARPSRSSDGRRSGSGRDGGRDGSRDGSRDGGRDDRNRTQRPQDGRRSAGGSAPNFADNDRQKRTGDAGRGRGTRSGSGGRQDGTGFNPSQDERSPQNKKKRGKGSRRTVDFQQNGSFDAQMDENESPRIRSSRSRKKKAVQAAPVVTQPLKAAKRKVRIEGTIRISDMAQQMSLKASELIKVLFNLGIMATINQPIDFDTAAILAAEFKYEVEKTGFEEKDYLEPSAPDRPEDLKPRPPVVTIMGHVDHGKTSLLDAIRKTHVTSGEAGGITQHIGAYHVRTKNGDVVFLDTPGHEAFTAMRARGAQITDLVILVVAADDGVMEQTREAVNHARAANVPIIVAVNKMDKPGANPDRVLRELAEMGLQAEEWGGDTIVCKVSAKTHEGLDELLELLALQSEVMELKANPDKPARGHIIEAKLDKGRGAVATVLIQEGTLHQGDTFVCGTFSGRVRALLNDQGKKVREAGPSIPVEVQGFTGVPVAGEEFAAIDDEKVARRIADARAIAQREKDLASESKVTLESFLAGTGNDEQKTLNLVVKADVQGSLEAVQGSLQKASTDKVTVNVVHGGTGAITESDILLASASKAIIIGFNIRPTAKIKEVAAHENVDIRFYDIIYKLVDDVKNAMAGLLAPVEKEVYLGQAEVRKTYSLPKVGTIAGSYVADGKIVRNAGARLLRDGVVVWTGSISSLKRFKDDAKEVARGQECGIGLENFNDIKDGDIIEAFDTVQEAATL